MKILIIEDEQTLAEDILQFLKSENYVCEHANTFELAKEKVQEHYYDCVLLDLMLPGGSGLDLLDILRKKNEKTGVIIISAKDSLEDKVSGLKSGSDDYLAKPFHQAELAARIQSIIRRKQFNGSNTIVYNELCIDLESKTASSGQIDLNLTRKEFELIVFFLGNKNRVLSKASLAEHLSGDFADMFDNHDFVYAHVKNLKKKLRDAGSSDYIKTVYGFGYKWEE